MNFDNGFLTIDSVEIGYRFEGSGSKSVVLLHGLNSHSGTWRKTIPQLVSHCSVLAPSLPAHKGQVSSLLAQSYAEIVKEMMEKLGIEGATVVGNSMGGWTAMKLARIRGGLVSQLVLEDAAGAHSEEATLLAKSPPRVSIAWGENDRVIPLSEGRFLHSLIPGSELHIIKAAAHVPHWETPTVFNELLADFMRTS